MDECEVPSVNSNPEEIKRVFSGTKTIAVVGLSPDPAKDSHRIALYLQGQGFKIVPVYPKGDTILGEKVYQNLSDIQEKVDMADLFVNAGRVPDIADQAIARGDIKTLWLQSGIVNNEAAQKARDAGLTVVQNKCAKVEHRRFLEERS